MSNNLTEALAQAFCVDDGFCSGQRPCAFHREQARLSAPRLAPLIAEREAKAREDMEPFVESLIEAAKAKAWDEGADAPYLASNPYRSAVSGEPSYNVIDTPIKDEPLDLIFDDVSGEPNA